MFTTKSRPLHLNKSPKFYPWNASKITKNGSDFKRNLITFLLNFCNNCSIDCFNYISNNEKHLMEKIVWLILVLMALCCTIVVCLTFSTTYYNRSLETIIANNDHENYHISFPVITICNRNRLNWSRFRAAQEHFLPGENNTDILNLFELIISMYDDIKFQNFQTFYELEHKPLYLLNHVNFSLVYDFMTWTCEELLTNCKWRNRQKNCCTIFSKRKSKMGLCWSFNTLITDEGKQLLDETKWPLRTGSSGPHSALQATILIKPEFHYPNSNQSKGIEIMITEPYSWHAPPIFVPSDTQTFIVIEPELFTFNNNTRILSVKERKCLFRDEISSESFKTLYGFPYMLENCFAECNQEYLMKYCNCTMNILFPAGLYPYCRAEDLPCLARHNDYIQYTYEKDEAAYVLDDFEKGMKCDCYRDCRYFRFIAEARVNHLTKQMRQNVSFIDLDVHYRYETFTTYSTRLAFNWLNLLVCFGGVVGLFMGCSILNLIEILYFFIVDVPIFLTKEIRMELSKRKYKKGAVKTLQYPQHQSKAWSNNYNLSNRRNFLYARAYRQKY